MKKSVMWLGAILLSGVTSLTLAQNTIPPNTQNPNAHVLHKRIREQLKQIAVDLKKGRITEAQARAKRDNVKAVHDKVVQYRQQNGSHELTDGQAKELNSSLDKNK